MKTFKKTIKEPRLKIFYDSDIESPRDWGSTLGYFLTKDSKYSSPDGERAPFIQRVIEEEGELADNQEDHIKRIKKRIEEEGGEKVIAIYPITKYEHSGVSYSLGSNYGFDYSNNGFYIITDISLDEVGADKKDFKTIIKAELEEYNRWANGEVYGFTLYNDKGKSEGGCYGFYSLDDIKSELGEEWKDENMEDYLIQ